MNTQFLVLFFVILLAAPTAWAAGKSSRQPKFHPPQTAAEKTLDTILRYNNDEKNVDVYGFVFNYPQSRKKQDKKLSRFFTRDFLDISEKEEKKLITESCNGKYPENGLPCEMIRSINPISCAQDIPEVYLYRTISSDEQKSFITYTWSGDGDGPIYRMIKESAQWKLDATSCGERKIDIP